MKTKTREKPKKKSYVWIWLLIILIGAIIVIAVPNKSITCYKMETETYIDTETYQDTEQYIDTVYNDKNLIYKISMDASDSFCVDTQCDRTEQYCVQKNFWGNCIKYETRCISSSCERKKVYCRWKLENLDDIGGYWNIERVIRADQDYKETSNIWVGARDGVTFYKDAVIDNSETWRCYYNVNEVPSKSVASQIVREKPVTKERPIEKERQVEKPYYKSVNWIFGEC